LNVIPTINSTLDRTVIRRCGSGGDDSGRDESTDLDETLQEEQITIAVSRESTGDGTRIIEQGGVGAAQEIETSGNPFQSRPKIARDG